MEIKVFLPNQFEQLEEYWKKLDCGADMTAFQKYEWYRVINTAYFNEKVKNIFRKWLYIVALDGKDPVMIAPIQVVKNSFSFTFKNVTIGLKKGFYLIGREGYTDYLNFIYDKFSCEAFDEIVKYVYRKYGFNYFNLERLIETSSLWKYIIDTYDVTAQTPISCYYLKLPSSFDEYTALLSKNTRQNIRTANNRQSKNSVYLTHEIVFEVNNEIKNSLIEMRAQRLPKKHNNILKKASVFGKLYYVVHDMINKFNYNVPVMNEAKNQWFFLVKDGERIVSYFWGIRDLDAKGYYVILAGVDKEYEWYSPSISHLYLFLKEYYENNRNDISMIDFTRGGEKYKKDIGCVYRSVSGLTFSVKL